MNELKYVCPSCGQHVECDSSHAGENFPCPLCAALVRVPSEAAFTDAAASPASPTAAPLAAELGKIFYTGSEPVGDGSGHESSAAIEDSASQAVANAGYPAALHATQSQAGGNAESHSELRCVCPVCQSELRISIEAGATARNASSGLNAQHDSSDHTQHPSMEERERQIAAARETHPGLHPTFKPRLDKILGDDGQHEAA
jgi:hypothetical protein